MKNRGIQESKWVNINIYDLVICQVASNENPFLSYTDLLYKNSMASRNGSMIFQKGVSMALPGISFPRVFLYL